MSKPTTLIIPLLLLLPFFVMTNGIRGKVGGRTQVKNVKQNQEIQELGRYCVGEYNHQLQLKANGSTALVFSQVVAAETQVISGIKYYLKISAVTRDGAPARTFDAVVVVKPWLHSKELLNFAPSPPPKSTK
ncbi:cysteine proteinase inhibitor B [Sesamum indicum]|uniref:Cysteine proteinase inhibitor B n=1 Tax=Sesamum indicum TaxID=4182 RepID=A0A6I9TLP9_SESIN|nr:cysteine proteinase inhibitor B [Sesamum indicum]